MCGIVGILANQSANQLLYDGLSVLQHRGQDAAGIMTADVEGRLHLRKDNGMVKDVFSQANMQELEGRFGIGHVRYPTAGSSSSAEAQPFYVNSPHGISLAHNGNLTNVDELRTELLDRDLRYLNTTSDSEVLLNVLAGELQQNPSSKLTPEKVFAAVAGVHKRCKGAYAVVAMIPNFGLIAFRDRLGIRPLSVGTRTVDGKQEVVIASESVTIDTLEFDFLRDIAPGEALVVTLDSQLHFKQCAEHPSLAPCLFEFVYMARPDSIIDDISVYKARLRMGDSLGQQILESWPDHDIDVVMPIPDTSRTSAVQVAYHLGVKYREGFIKNRYIGRTFIMPGQQERKRSVRQKLNAIDLEFRGKNVLLVDDSIVRGTTSRQIIQMARDAGANKVYMSSAAPPVRFPNVYGIDMPSASELIAHDRSIDEVAELIGADRLFYLELERLKEAVSAGNSLITQFDTSVFDGQYITGDIDDAYLRKIDEARNDGVMSQKAASGNKDVTLDIRNVS